MTRPKLPTARRSDGSRVWRTRDLAAQIAWWHEEIAEVSAMLDRVVHRAACDVDDGPAGGSRRIADDGSKNGRVPGFVIAHLQAGDPVHEAMARICARVVRVGDDLEHLAADARFLVGLDPSEASTIATLERLPAGAGFCVVCDRWVPGSREDRLREGRCERDYRFRKLHGRDAVRGEAGSPVSVKGDEK